MMNHHKTYFMVPSKTSHVGRALTIVVLVAVMVFSVQSPYVFATTTTTVDSDGNVGTYTDTAIASDGFARISYYDVTNQNLKYVKCGDATCTSGNATITTVDSTGNVGRDNSIAIASDGFARISYWDVTNRDLKYVQCGDAACTITNATITTVDSIGFVGSSTSIAIASDGFARISYYDQTNTVLKYVQCGDAACTPGNAVLSTVDSTGGVGELTSIAIASDGFARISYSDGTNADLKYVQCGDAACTAGNATITTVDSVGNVGQFSSIAIASDGFGRIAYRDVTNQDLKYVQCKDAACNPGGGNPAVITTVDSVGIVGSQYNSIALGSDGFARISYHDFTNSDLKYARCTNASCSSNTKTSIHSPDENWGQYTSIAIASDGFARISFYDGTNQFLKFTQCTNAACDNTPDAGPTTPVTSRKDTLVRAQVSTLANHTIEFTTSTGVAAGQTITITLPSGFSIPGTLDFTDVDVSYGPTTGLENELTLAASASGATWGASVSGQVLTITSGTGTISATSRVVIEVGTNATTGTTGDQRITNPSSAGSYIMSIGGTFNQNGDIAIAITESDQVTATATVSPSLTFDIDAATTDSDTNTPYNITLGTLSVGTLSTSRTDSTGTINALFFDVSTNAVSGATVTMQGANTGLTSIASATTITLPSNEATITAGQERVGVCLSSLTASGGGTLTANANYDADGTSNCTSTNGGTPKVGKIQTTASPLFTSGGAPVSAGRATLLLKASITAITPAASDYTNTLTFIAVGTF